MTGHDAGLVVRELGSRLELETAQTRYRGHAGELAAASVAQGYDLVVTFGGDGTVNEVVNGLMRSPVPAVGSASGGDAAVLDGGRPGWARRARRRRRGEPAPGDRARARRWRQCVRPHTGPAA